MLLQVVFGHAERLLDVEQPVVGVDHKLGSHGGAVGAGGEVGDVSLQTGQGPRLSFKGAVHGPGAAGELDEPVALNRGLTRNGFLGLGDLFVDAAQGAPGPIVPVLVVDDLVPALVARPGRPGLDEHLSVRDVLAGMLTTPLVDRVGTWPIRAPRMNDNPASSIAFWLAAEIMPASATIVTSGRSWACMKARMVGSMVSVSALLPSNASTINGNRPSRSAGRW
jgi:hypothetical protein